MYYIYKIENLKNHKKYIGLTNNVQRRRARHFTDLRCNRHDNSFLQKEFNIYGEENFDFSVEFEGDVTPEEISEKEKFYIQKYDSYKNGYNQNEGGNFGPSNGGTHLTQADIFNILAALEFMSRPGQILSNMYDVSKTTISRIKHGVNHSQYKEQYDALPLEERKQIYKIFCDSTNFYEDKVKTTILKTKRNFTKEQVFMIYANEEFSPRLIPIRHLCAIFNKTNYTFYSILKHESYKDYALEYSKIMPEEKEKIVSSLKKLAKENSFNCGEAQT